MSTSELNFRISESVAAMTQEYQSYVPPAGSTVDIVEFLAEAAYERDIEAAIIWDYEGPNEQFLWTIKGSGKFGNKITIPSTDTDGIKKLALVLDNGTLLSLTMSAAMTILVTTNE